MVHRDLKPGNIMLGDYGEVYVLDWGVSRIEQEELQTQTSAGPDGLGPSPAADLTLTGTFLGTPGYMPPEQAAGHPVDRRADVYALGAVLFEILTWGQLGIHKKPVAVLNAGGFFDPLLAWADHMTTEGFLKPKHRALLLVAATVEELFEKLSAYQPPAPTEKWATREER